MVVEHVAESVGIEDGMTGQDAILAVSHEFELLGRRRRIG
jgi:hypothetical protein